MTPILFNTDMTKAILDGKKTQTRRAISKFYDDNKKPCSMPDKDCQFMAKAKYKAGDILWVREPVEIIGFSHTRVSDSNEFTVRYKADGVCKSFPITEDIAGKSWLKMNAGIPNGCLKVMARTFIEITEVKIEELQDISCNDCTKEGILIHETGEDYYYTSIGAPDWKNGSNVFGDYSKNKHNLSLEHLAFVNLWNKTAKAGYKWEDKPYVFVYGFKKIDGDK